MSLRGKNVIQALKSAVVVGAVCVGMVASSSSSWAASPREVASARMAITSASAITLRNDMNNKCLQAAVPNGSQASLWDCGGSSNFYWYWDGMQIRNLQ